MKKVSFEFELEVHDKLRDEDLGTQLTLGQRREKQQVQKDLFK